MGPRWVLYRAGYALRKKSGLLKARFPAGTGRRTALADFLVDGVPAEPQAYRDYRRRQKARFFFEPGALPDLATIRDVAGQAAVARTIAVADDYAQGRFLYYSRHVHDLGWPPNWLLNPFTGFQYDTRLHWCDTPTFSAEAGDVKDIWEPSRFACAFWLARAYALTGDEKHAEAFWTLFESWCDRNPPNMGPNWKCGQETALRSMAWCFALHVFWNAPATTPQRIAALVRMLAIQAERIAGNIDFAVSQSNNHALSEAVGLLTTGLLFPELRQAEDWQALGRRVLEREVPRQIYEDGAYVQHSMNYHRVMLHDCLWAIRLAELNGRPLSAGLVRRVAAATEFLCQMADPKHGRVPNYGSNDGALILPLNGCDYTDYRPVVQAAAAVTSGRRVYPSGPWDEDLLWLLGREALDLPAADTVRKSAVFESGGYYTVTGPSSWGMVRCHDYKNRAGHVDMLHFDLWADGINLLRDCGSYRYFTHGEPELRAYFKSIQAHNTITVDGRSPLRMVSHFTALPYPRGRLEAMETSDGRQVWKGAHFAYEERVRGFAHTREIVAESAAPRWTVTDCIRGEGEHELQLRWHLPLEAVLDGSDDAGVHVTLPAGWKLEIAAPSNGKPTSPLQADMLEASSHGGYESLYYAEKSPIRTLSITVRCSLPAVFRTVLYKELAP